MRVVKIIRVLIIVIILVIFLRNHIFQSDHCEKLRKYGFDYGNDGIGSRSPGWDTIQFDYWSPKKSGIGRIGPTIAGYRLKVNCYDIDNDGLEEFIIRSQVWEAKHCILKVDLDSGMYHVHYAKGLDISYPKEGFHYH